MDGKIGEAVYAFRRLQYPKQSTPFQNRAQIAIILKRAVALHIRAQLAKITLAFLFSVLTRAVLCFARRKPENSSYFWLVATRLCILSALFRIMTNQCTKDRHP